MIKTIFFDLDGVLTTDAKGSLTMSKNICEARPNLAVDVVLQSFRKDMKLLSTGQCTLQSVIERVCSEFSIPYSQEFFVDVARKTTWNKKMIELSNQLSTKRGIITDNSVERMEILSREPELSGFDPIVVSAGEQASKADGSTKIYDSALRQAGCAAAEAVFIDNQEKNLVIPAQMGFTTYFHDDVRNDIDALREALRTLSVEVS